MTCSIQVGEAYPLEWGHDIFKNFLKVDLKYKFYLSTDWLMMPGVNSHTDFRTQCVMRTLAGRGLLLMTF